MRDANRILFIFLGAALIPIGAQAGPAGYGSDRTEFYLPQVCRLTEINPTTQKTEKTCTASIVQPGVIITSDWCVRDLTDGIVLKPDALKLECNCDRTGCKNILPIKKIKTSDNLKRKNLPLAFIDIEGKLPADLTPLPGGITGDFFDLKTGKLKAGKECFFGGYGVNAEQNAVKSPRYFKISDFAVAASEDKTLLMESTGGSVNVPKVAEYGAGVIRQILEDSGLSGDNAQAEKKQLAEQFSQSVASPAGLIHAASHIEKKKFLWFSGYYPIKSALTEGDKGGPVLCRDGRDGPLKQIGLNYGVGIKPQPPELIYKNYFISLPTVKDVPFKMGTAPAPKPSPRPYQQPRKPQKKAAPLKIT